MKNKFFKTILATIIFTFAFTLSVKSAVAEDEICAAIYPCLENGEILPEFNKPGFCGDHFRQICSKAKTSLMSDELVTCQKENEQIQNSQTKLSKKIRSLRLKLKRTK